jgi:pyruvate formate lyase activating enzyme
MPARKKPHGQAAPPGSAAFQPAGGGLAPAGEPAGPRGLVFDIQGHSVHDGPGTRTTVFLSGCPLRCGWCCNPEGLFRQPVAVQRPTKCVHCGACASACPSGAVSLAPNRPPVLDRSRCDRCESRECVPACFHEGLAVVGQYYGVDDLMRIFHRDRQFWGARGGVTFSGGEPLLQREFIRAILKRCKEASIHTCIETSACLPEEDFRAVLPYLDWIFADIKHMDPEVHRQVTGVDNRRILANIRLLAGDEWQGFPVVRIPVIPGVNDREANIRATARWVGELGLEVINILPYHRMGESKYRQLGQACRFGETSPPSPESMARIQWQVEAEGLVCYVGYRTPF